MPDEDSTGEARLARVPPIPRATARPHDARSGQIDLAGGVIGIVSVAILFLGVSAGVSLHNIAVYLGSIVLVLISGLIAIVFAARARLRSAWAVVGLVTGILSMLGAIFAGVVG